MNRQVLFRDDGTKENNLNAIRAMIRDESPSPGFALQMTQDAINAVRKRLKSHADEGSIPSPQDPDWHMMKDDHEIVALYYIIQDNDDPDDPNSQHVPYVLVDEIRLLKIL